MSSKRAPREHAWLTIGKAIVLGLCIGLGLIVLTRPAPVHLYTVVRWNDAARPLEFPTLMDGSNPKIVMAQIHGTRYENADCSCYTFYLPRKVSTLCGVITIQDHGVVE